jgi:preprotein translocase subunit SecE
MDMEKVKETLAKFGSFIREVLGELSKVAWPTPARTAKLTGVVIGIVVLVMGFLWLLDLPLGLGLKWIAAR